jgi:hypothetical protein
MAEQSSYLLLALASTFIFGFGLYWNTSQNFVRSKTAYVF